MSDVALWIQTLQALATPVIGAAAGALAFMQWRTAHQKVVLDLFERRMQVFAQAKAAVRYVSTHGKSGGQAQASLLLAINEAQFLFGNDVKNYLETLWEAYVNLETLDATLADMEKGPERVQTNKQRRIEASKVTAFYQEGPKVFAPYMSMDQRLIRTPKQWLEAANRKRLGYADEKQK